MRRPAGSFYLLEKLDNIADMFNIKNRYFVVDISLFSTKQPYIPDECVRRNLGNSKKQSYE